MTPNQLEDIFVKYLKRKPSPRELEIHGHKDYDLFTQEVLNCIEYKIINNQIIPAAGDINVAVLLSGHIRGLSVVPGLEKMCELYNVDVFLHTWDTVGTKGTETNLSVDSDRSGVEFAIKEIPNLESFKIENNKQWIEKELILLDAKKPSYFNFSSPEVFIKSQLYSINQSFMLMDEHVKNTSKKYDIVIRLRCDSSLAYTEITPKLISLINSKKIIFTPNQGNGRGNPDYDTSCQKCDTMFYKYGLSNVHIDPHSSIVCDIMAYGSFSSMRDYCDIYHKYDDVCEEFYKLTTQFIDKTPDLDLDITIVGRDRIYGKNNFHLGHVQSIYYSYCSYPERVITHVLRDYMLVSSTAILVYHNR